MRSSNASGTQQALYALSDELTVLLDHANEISLESTCSATRLAETLLDISHLASRTNIALRKYYARYNDDDGLADPTSAMFIELMHRSLYFMRGPSSVTSLEYYTSGIKDLKSARPPYAMAVAWQDWYDPIDSSSMKTGEEIGQELVRWMEKQIKKTLYHTLKLTEVDARLKADRKVAEDTKDALNGILKFYKMDHSTLTDPERRMAERRWLKAAVEGSDALDALE
ncbi:hypothetical protein DL546_005642 [Coniochaeta pulveracea]|uniref:Uncharacterized protein n=1 Tax=Coniochaeta pulveracea TaxID=177199 RepID=A0A420Y4D1_9PEZI|nr:hypothetical protein DL546_005642 [Coniochaeta pulveracea]